MQHFDDTSPKVEHTQESVFEDGQVDMLIGNGHLSLSTNGRDSVGDSDASGNISQTIEEADPSVSAHQQGSQSEPASAGNSSGLAEMQERQVPPGNISLGDSNSTRSPDATDAVAGPSSQVRQITKPPQPTTAVPATLSAQASAQTPAASTFVVRAAEWMSTLFQPPADRTTPNAPKSGLTREDFILRNIRIQVQDLQEHLNRLVAGSVDYTTFAGAVAPSVTDIQKLIDSLADATVSEDLYSIKTTWSSMKMSPLLQPTVQGQQSATPDAQTIVNQSKILNDQCKKIVYLVGYRTIPSVLNIWLRHAPSGYYIPFHKVFQDEIQDPDDRAKLLQAISWAPATIEGGLVDVTSGIVYRYSTNAWRRLLSLVGVFAALALSVAIIFAVCNSFWLTRGNESLPDWPYKPVNAVPMLVAWGAILLGVLVHVGVSITKRAQSTGLPPVFAPTNSLALVNAQFGNILYKLFLILLALFGLVGFVGLSEAVPYTAFVTGYSLDSVVELLSTAFSNAASTRAESIKSLLGVK